LSTYGQATREAIRGAFQAFLDYCQQNKVPVVIAAGNTPRTLDANENLPHILSKPEDSMIIVGGVDQTGRPFDQMVSDKDNLVHVWSPGADIETPISATQSATGSGTSRATAIVVRVAFLLLFCCH
jgi:hypothetical protein